MTKPINELSKTTLKSYVKKASKSAEKHYQKGNAEEDKAMSTDGEKYPEKQARHHNAAVAHNKMELKRTNGINRAMLKFTKLAKVPVSEETIDELSQSTIDSYRKKGQWDLDDADDFLSAEDKKEPYVANLLKKRKAGQKMAALATSRNALKRLKNTKMTKEEVEQVDELSNHKLNQYIKKAGAQAFQATDSAASLEDRLKKIKPNLDDGPSDYEVSLMKGIKKFKNKSDKRMIGITKAVHKLTKEETMDETIQLIEMAEDKNILDFTAKMDEILRAKSIALVESLMGGDEDEDEDEFNFEDEEEEELEESLSEDELSWIAENITDEEFEALDDESKEALLAFVGDEDEDDDELEEGRGARGRAKHPKMEDEWGSKAGKSKSFKSFLKGARKAKESMREETSVEEETIDEE